MEEEEEEEDAVRRRRKRNAHVQRDTVLEAAKERML